MLHLSRRYAVVGLVLGLLANQSTHAVENGWHPTFIGTGSGSDTWGRREGVVFVHSFWFDSHRDNMVFKIGMASYSLMHPVQSILLA
jgi:hypothetical protein